MENPPIAPPARRRLFTLLAVPAIILASPCPGSAGPAPERGAIGIVFRQLFDEAHPSHRGPLVVLQVIDGSAAAKAGIRSSDFVTAVNGTPVAGRPFPDILERDLRGSVGAAVRLTVLRFDGTQSEIALVRAPLAPHASRPSDPFLYTVPGGWGADSRYSFPLPWSPALPYHGFEDLYYAPNFDDTGSPEYHSYLFFIWLEGAPPISAGQLRSDMLVYFRGLAEERGRNYGFTPDVSKVAAAYARDAAPRTLRGAAVRTFSGSVTIWDTHGKLITLNCEVVAWVAPDSAHTALFLGMSLEPRTGDIWSRLDAIRDTFRLRG